MSEVKPQVREVQLLRVTHLCVIVYLFLSVFLSVSHTESSPERLKRKKKGHRLQQISVYPGIHFVPEAAEHKMLQMSIHG